ncbi:11924_t:CDS:2, partial [Entrophospora sp. SA101]
GNRRSLSSKKWRFYRLSPNAKFLHYCDFTEKSYIREGIEDLPERNNVKADSTIVSTTPINLTGFANRSS